MIFRHLRRTWHRERFQHHWAKIAIFVEQRQQEERRPGHKGKVLSTNYELVSHATRALEALRKAEELGARLGKDVPEVRRYLQYLINLPSLPAREIQAAAATEIDRLYDEFQSYRRRSPEAKFTDPTPEKTQSKNHQDLSSGAQSTEEVLRQLHDRAQTRLQDFDEETALQLVSKLNQQKIDEGVEAEGISLAECPMPLEEQARLMRIVYATVGQPFDGETWYNLMIAAWLTYNARHDRGELAFDYRHAVNVYRRSAAQKLGNSPEAEAAFANMIGAIYTLITGEPYDFTPPRPRKGRDTSY